MEVDKELKSIINSGRIPNAFLFEGPAGSGKLKSAIGFAQSLFMLNSSNNNLNTNFSTNLAHPSMELGGNARELMFPFPPSSPCIALFKNGELVHMLERHHIEGREASLISENLKQAYNEYC